MSDDTNDNIVELLTEPEDLKPKRPSNRAPEGIRNRNFRGRSGN